MPKLIQVVHPSASVEKGVKLKVGDIPYTAIAMRKVTSCKILAGEKYKPGVTLWWPKNCLPGQMMAYDEMLLLIIIIFFEIGNRRHDDIVIIVIKILYRLGIKSIAVTFL
jgi:hypothetical protein